MSSEKREIVDISNKSIFRLFSAVLIFIFGIYFLYSIKNVLVMLIISGFLALSIYRPVKFLATKLRVSTTIGTIIAYSLVVGILGYLIYATFPSLIKQLYSLVINAPNTIETARNTNSFAAFAINAFDLEQKSNQLSQYASTHWQDIVHGFAGQFQSFVSFIYSLITILIITLLIVAEGPEMIDRLWDIVEDGNNKKKYQKLLYKMYGVITGYTNGQVILTTLNATFALIFMMIASKIVGVNIQYPLAIWALVWMAGLIPFVGATLGAAVSIFFTIFLSWKLSLAIAIYYAVYQQIENSTLQPWIQSKSINASALTIFVAALIGASFGGIVGTFVAIPLAGCMKVGIDFYLRENSKSIRIKKNK